MTKHPQCDRGLDLARTAIQSQADIIIAQAPGVATLDIDAIHDMRVATRRLRMALKIYAPWVPARPGKRLRSMARDFTRDLGTRRELDVMAAMLREHREETHGVWQRFMDHAIEVIDTRRNAQAPYCREAAEAAQSPNFRAAVDTVLSDLNSQGVCAIDLAEAGLLGALAEARAARREWKQSGDPEALHLVRIALKHLRYACEFHAPLYGDAMTTHIAHIKHAQEILGEWNECRLLEDMVLALGGAADYTLAQGAPLVAEAYGNHAIELAEKFGPMGKALLGKAARKDFEALITEPAMTCCQEDPEYPPTNGECAPCDS